MYKWTEYRNKKWGTNSKSAPQILVQLSPRLTDLKILHSQCGFTHWILNRVDALRDNPPPYSVPEQLYFPTHVISRDKNVSSYFLLMLLCVGNKLKMKLSASFLILFFSSSRFPRLAWKYLYNVRSLVMPLCSNVKAENILKYWYIIFAQ